MVPKWDLQPLRAATIGFYHTILCMSTPKIHYFSGFQDIFNISICNINLNYYIICIAIYANVKLTHLTGK